MKTSREILLDEIEAFLTETGTAPTAFGLQVMNDRHLVRRLRAGGEVTLTTADRVRHFIASSRKPHPKKRAAYQPAA